MDRVDYNIIEDLLFVLQERPDNPPGSLAIPVGVDGAGHDIVSPRIEGFAHHCLERIDDRVAGHQDDFVRYPFPQQVLL